MNCELSSIPCRLCGYNQSIVCDTILHKPKRETDFNISADNYKRIVKKCLRCGVYFNDHKYIPADFYNGNYNDATYGDSFHKRYEFVRGLPNGLSDNRLRAARVDQYLVNRGKKSSESWVLDVGMGLCVFLAEMKDKGYNTVGIDPDLLSVVHAAEQVGINEAFQGVMESFEATRMYNLISFNKVLEHVPNAIESLSRWKKWLLPDGVIYLELPDGEAASKDGGYQLRQEFFIEHLTIFGPQSLNYLCDSAGYKILELKQIHEPSDKYTIYAFITPS